MGAWIETPLRGKEEAGRLVAPRVGAWIETNVGAWIETIIKITVTINNSVAPRVGAWIETRATSASTPILASRAPRGRVD